MKQKCQQTLYILGPRSGLLSLVSKAKDALVNYWGTLFTLFAKLFGRGLLVLINLFLTNLKLHWTKHKIAAYSKESIKDSIINFY